VQFEEYMQELRQVKTLEAEQEAELWQSYKEQGDTQARRLIIESYQPLVFKQALPYRKLPNVMDIVQEGTIGLIEAVEHYDYERGVAFSLYAVHRIRGRMLNFLQREGRVDLACMEAEAEGMTLKDQLMDQSPPVTEQAETHELIGRVRQAMERLPQKERAVLEGIYIDDAAASDVAGNLDVSVSHIYRLQKSGVRRVRGMLSRFMQHW